MKNKIKIISVVGLSLLLTTGCSFNNLFNNKTKENAVAVATDNVESDEMFTERDLLQDVDISDAKTYNVSDGENISITEEGVYVIKGSAKNVTISIDADSKDKVQLVLDNLNITNTSQSCIYVKSADKVFINLIGDNNLSVTSSFNKIVDVNSDAVIFSKDDLVINGSGSLNIDSTDNGITSKDKLKITGGNITINSKNDALEANDGIAIADGNITINSEKDGIHAEYDEDNSVGFVYIKNGNLNISAGDDAIHATTYVQIDDGTLVFSGREGIEATVITINSGDVKITASDDGINGAQKCKSLTISVEINGGNITIDMGQGDTDAIDSNGNLYINGGTLRINAQSPFDYDGEAKYSGGTMIVNGEETTTISNQMMGGGPRVR